MRFCKEKRAHLFPDNDFLTTEGEMDMIVFNN